MDVEEKLEEVTYIGWLFIGLIAASLILADALIRRVDLVMWFAAGALAGATMLGYSLCRSVGLPGEHDEQVGKWTEPLGLASLLLEGCTHLCHRGQSDPDQLATV
jgi:hypothetical protein